jgi:hypothetical protein
MEPSHTYKQATRGRSLFIDPRGGTRCGRMICVGCGEVGSVNFTALPPPELLDKKFAQKGWELDPNTCPACVIKRKTAKAVAKKEQKTMNTTNTNTKPNGTLADNPVLKAVSADTHKATAKMHQMLSTHFDAEAGLYEEGWNDERVSKESGISVIHITEVRNIAYGELKEPEEITLLRNEIKSLNDLIGETLVAAQKEVNALNKRVAELCAKLGIK